MDNKEFKRRKAGLKQAVVDGEVVGTKFKVGATCLRLPLVRFLEGRLSRNC